MLSATSLYNIEICCGKTGLKEAFPAGLMPLVQDLAFWKQRDSTCQCAMGRGEGSSCCSSGGEVEKALGPCDRGVTPTELPGDAKKKTHRRLVGKWHQLCSMRVPVLVLVLVLVLVPVVLVAVLVPLAVFVPVAVASGRPGGSLAPVPACPHEWVGHRGVCYYLSSEEGSWEWSRERCSSLGASLAVPKEPLEMEFLLRLKGNIDYWVGLRRRDQELEGVNGSSFNHSFPVQGRELCVYLSGDACVSGSCSQARQYLCRKPPALE